jgi:iron complex transport system substrate-binding protein
MCLLILILTLALSACVPVPSPTPAPKPTPTPLTLTDQLGREITLEKPAQRIVSLAPSNTEILFILGLGDRVIGVDEISDFPPEVKEKERVGSYANPSIEKIIALSPDLILAASIHKKTVIPELEKHGLNVLALAPKNLDGVLDSIALVGRAAGAEEAAEKVISSLRSRIKAVTEKAAELPPEKRPRVFFVVWHQPLWTAGSDTFIADLIEKAGGKNLASDIQGYAAIDLETVVARDPEVIIANTGHGEAKNIPYQWAQSEPRLAETSARKNHRVYEIDADLVNRPGPRIVQGLEFLARFIHPELFE